ncbi:cation diffusion facilitator family transporter [Carnobacterium iners]|uniref:Cation diffusion facilitator family transporter n=1 Tax=Carnobacterium iners TaxID=1073423 RepID=A0A1X7MQV2_9LACT|nr:cation diffusion facilitator family transporter [Carnobacterium iners]SEL01464.1 cation diffusion facilitator family transporter [Carnobacterium iners]SMH27200.1 cation diffusion facilitator family transporter [Carnobacterium iners]
MQDRYEELKRAEKGAIVSIVAYIFLSLIKIFVGVTYQSAALRADGLNNLTDVFSSLAVLVGLKLARRPADDDHPYGHWKAETIASLITSFVMLFVGIQVFYSSFNRIIDGGNIPPEKITGFIGFVGAIIMMGVYFYNLKLAKKINSDGLKAVAKDNLSDALTSLGTTIAIIGSMLGYIWMDGVMAIIVSIIIIKTGIEIFSDSAFSLSDGFNTTDLGEYKKRILSLPNVLSVKDIKARKYGANVYVDVTILVDATLTVLEGHQITENVERILRESYGIIDIDVHVEPDQMNKSK